MCKTSFRLVACRVVCSGRETFCPDLLNTKSKHSETNVVDSLCRPFPEKCSRRVAVVVSLPLCPASPALEIFSILSFIYVAAFGSPMWSLTRTRPSESSVCEEGGVSSPSFCALSRSPRVGHSAGSTGLDGMCCAGALFPTCSSVLCRVWERVSMWWHFFLKTR